MTDPLGEGMRLIWTGALVAAGGLIIGVVAMLPGAMIAFAISTFATWSSGDDQIGRLFVGWMLLPWSLLSLAFGFGLSARETLRSKR